MTVSALWAATERPPSPADEAGGSPEEGLALESTATHGWVIVVHGPCSSWPVVLPLRDHVSRHLIQGPSA